MNYPLLFWARRRLKLKSIFTAQGFIILPLKSSTKAMSSSSMVCPERRGRTWKYVSPLEEMERMKSDRTGREKPSNTSLVLPILPSSWRSSTSGSRGLPGSRSRRGTWTNPTSGSKVAFALSWETLSFSRSSTRWQSFQVSEWWVSQLKLWFQLRSKSKSFSIPIGSMSCIFMRSAITYVRSTKSSRSRISIAEPQGRISWNNLEQTGGIGTLSFVIMKSKCLLVSRQIFEATTPMCSFATTVRRLLTRLSKEWLELETSTKSLDLDVWYIPTSWAKVTKISVSARLLRGVSSAIPSCTRRTW